MHLEYRNINEGFRGVIKGIQDGRIKTKESDSRNGKVIRAEGPVVFEFTHPCERVLFNSARDVNPFSVLYESLWTLAGRNDVDPIAYYTPRMREFSDDGKTWHGAYGHRWRNHFMQDQIRTVVEQLKRSSSDRRAVLEMWDARVDCGGVGKDLPCNTHIYVTIREEKLNITVCNRSNDTVWGLFGTNYVVFSFLQEMLAALVGVPAGTYYHFTNDLHAYVERVDWKPEQWLNEHEVLHDRYCDMEDGRQITPFPLVKDPEVFERELPKFVETYSGDSPNRGTWTDYDEPFFVGVAGPMMRAFNHYKNKDLTQALRTCESIAADDWRFVAIQWLKKRLKNKEKTNVSE